MAPPTKNRHCLNCDVRLSDKALETRQHGWLCDNCDPVTRAFMVHINEVKAAEKTRNDNPDFIPAPFRYTYEIGDVFAPGFDPRAQH